MKTQFQGVGANHWLLEGRNGVARGVFGRFAAGYRFSSKQFLSEVQWRLNSLLLAGAHSAYQLVFASNPADPFGWRDGDEDLLFAQDALLLRQSVQQWKLRI